VGTMARTAAMDCRCWNRRFMHRIQVQTHTLSHHFWTRGLTSRVLPAPRAPHAPLPLTTTRERAPLLRRLPFGARHRQADQFRPRRTLSVWSGHRQLRFSCRRRSYVLSGHPTGTHRRVKGGQRTLHTSLCTRRKKKTGGPPVCSNARNNLHCHNNEFI